MKPATFEKKLEATWPGQFRLLTNYTGSRDPIEARCLRCGQIRKVNEARNLLRRGCLSCRSVNRGEEYAKKLEAAWPGQFEILSQYTGSKDPIEVRCRKCGQIRRGNIADVLIREGCPVCRRAKKFAEQLEAAWPGQYEILSQYTRSRDPIEVRCRKCGQIWRSDRAEYILRSGCPSCKKIEDFAARLEAARPGQYEILTRYTRGKDPIEVRCRKCGQIRRVNFADVLIREGCPTCGRARKFAERIEAAWPGQFEILTGYTVNDDSIVAKCRKCGNTKRINAAEYLKLRGCSDCKKAEKFAGKLEAAWPGQFEILTRYTGSNDSIAAKCRKCGCVRRVRARYLLEKGCAVCDRPEIKEKRKDMTAAEKFAEKLEAVSPGQYEILTEYTGSSDPIEVRCLKCGQIRKVREARDLIRKGCPVCRRPEYAAKKAAGVWIKNIENVESQGFKALTPFTGRRDPMLWKCVKCGREFFRDPEQAVLRGISCDHGEAERRRALSALVVILKRRSRQLQREEDRHRFITELLADYEARGYTVIKISEDLKTVTLRHDACGRVYNISRQTLERGSGCIACSRNGSSRGVREIERILKEKGLQYEREKKFDSCRRINPLPFDFEIVEEGKTKALIEYNGEQHYRATVMFGGPEKLEQIQDSDRIKREWAEAEGIPLLVIRYDEDIRSRLSELL